MMNFNLPRDKYVHDLFKPWTYELSKSLQNVNLSYDVTEMRISLTVPGGSCSWKEYTLVGKGLQIVKLFVGI